MRASQPLIGFLNNVCELDIAYLNTASSGKKQLIIFDCRSKSAAMANKFKNGGYEDHSLYMNCSILFGNLPNIHYVSDAYRSLFAAFKGDSNLFLSEAVSTGWLENCAKLLEGAKIVSISIEKGYSVLVHCSDGWDRTSQVSALAQIISDPYYRTFIGFEALVEKEFAQFGFQFSERTGVTEKSDKSHISPVFVQFLDCVHQLIFQFDEAFEFNVDFLEVLALESVLGRFGNFLLNCIREREENGLYEKSLNFWRVVEKYHLASFKNQIYTEQKSLMNVDCSTMEMRFWYEHFIPKSTSAHKRCFDATRNRKKPPQEDLLCFDKQVLSDLYVSDYIGKL